MVIRVHRRTRCPPADATVVAFNFTSVDATAPTFVTVWPAGSDRPQASNLNPVPGMAVPNLVVARLGDNETINMFNNTGHVELIADLVGYLTADSTVGLNPDLLT